MCRLMVLWLAAAGAVPAAGQMEAARAGLRDGHVDAAIAILRKQAEKEPAPVDAILLLGQVLLSGERFDEADEVVDPAVARNPDNAPLACLAGDLRYREGRVFDADKAYKAAVKIDPKNARAIYGIARVFRASSLRKKAYEMMRVAHAIDANDPEIARAFYMANPYSKAALDYVKAQQAANRDTPDRKGDPAIERRLQRLIAELEALDGRTGCEVAEPDKRHQVPLGRLMNGRRITGVSIALKIGGSSTDLRLDTGAGGILVSSRFAGRTGIRRLADTEIGGIGNEAPIKGWIGLAPRLQIGDMQFGNCLVEVPEKGSPDDSGGLIGTDVFDRFLVKINFAGHSLDLSPLPGPAWDGRALVDRYEGPELAGYSQMLIVSHDLLIPTLISESNRAGQTDGLLLLDTGAQTNMISTNLAPAITKIHDSDSRIRGISGKVKNVYRADQVVLQFATYRQLNLDLISFDLAHISRGARMEVSGIMGLPLIAMFEAVTLDYRDGRVKFEYKR